jgi:hypothetical protein
MHNHLSELDPSVTFDEAKHLEIRKIAEVVKNPV